MKKIFIVCVLIMSLTVVGCNSKDTTKEKEEKFETFAKDYYNRFGKSVEGAAMTYEVTLESLENANASNALKKKDKYDLSMFKDCKKSSIANLKVSENQKIESVQIKLNCE